jgi:hypothetical protein
MTAIGSGSIIIYNRPVHMDHKKHFSETAVVGILHCDGPLVANISPDLVRHLNKFLLQLEYEYEYDIDSLSTAQQATHW